MQKWELLLEISHRNLIEENSEEIEIRVSPSKTHKTELKPVQHGTERNRHSREFKMKIEERHADVLKKVLRVQLAHDAVL